MTRCYQLQGDIMNTLAQPTTSTTELETEYAFRQLTLNDRCDADSAEAAVAQVVVGDQVLLFCGHHWRVNAASLATFPHSVPAEDSKPMTWRRAAELGAPEQRDSGSAV